MPSKLSEDDYLEEEGQSDDSEEMSPKKRSLRGKKNQDQAPAPKVSDPGALRTGEKRVLIAESHFLKENPEIVALRHPKSKKSASFIFNEDNTEMREIMTYTEENRCWFIGECIESNGKVFIACSIDPCLLVLPYLMSSERNVPLQQLLVDSEFPEISRLSSNSALMSKLDKIADSKGSRDLNVWKYNEEKTLEFLSTKVKRLSKYLLERGIDVRGGAMSGNYVKSLNDKVDEVKYLRYAHGILSEYLNPDLSKKLEVFMKIPAEEKPKVQQPQSKKRESVDKMENSSKKSKKHSGPDEDYSQSVSKSKQKEVVLTAKQKALAKNATGTKSIMSFFGKKN